MQNCTVPDPDSTVDMLLKPKNTTHKTDNGVVCAIYSNLLCDQQPHNPRGGWQVVQLRTPPDTMQEAAYAHLLELL